MALSVLPDSISDLEMAAATFLARNYHNMVSQLDFNKNKK